MSEARSEIVFADADRRVLAALADLLIPAASDFPAASAAEFGSVGDPWTSSTPGRRPPGGGSSSARARTAPTRASPMR